jgi:integrative and conjugative element protein (TIGR02256 family)
MPHLRENAVSLCFRHSLGIVQFEDHVLDVFQESRQLNPWSRESGGQLFCRFSGEKLLIEHATKPGDGDKRSRYSFWPNRKKEQGDINSQFEQNLHYIGDWHTHPESMPKPSGDDIRKMQAIYRKSIHSLSCMILVVVGKEKIPEGLWVGIIDHEDVFEAELTIIK